MSVLRFAHLILFLPALSLAAPASASDSLILQEIADSLRVRLSAVTATWEGGRVTRMSLFYESQQGAVPAALGGLDSLRRLYMAITLVTSVPKEIGLLKRLDSIDIISSHLGPVIPAEIGELPNLRFLRISRCKLKSLPGSLMNLKKLEYADFSRNNICHVDDSLRQWILARWPKALDDQDTSACATTGLRQKHSRPGDKRAHGAPLIRCYTPLGRTVWWDYGME
jgi:hypothetical protein